MQELSNTNSNQLVVDAQSDNSVPFWTTFRRVVRTWPLVPIFLIALLLIAAIFAELLTPYDPEKDDLLARNTLPCGKTAVQRHTRWAPTR